MHKEIVLDLWHGNISINILISVGIIGNQNKKNANNRQKEYLTHFQPMSHFCTP